MIIYGDGMEMKNYPIVTRVPENATTALLPNGNEHEVFPNCEYQSKLNIKCPFSDLNLAQWFLLTLI